MKDIIRMNQLAGIITEGQARKIMEILNEESDEDLVKQLTNLPVTETMDPTKALTYGKFLVFKEPWFGENSETMDSFIFRVYDDGNNIYWSKNPEEIIYYLKNGKKPNTYGGREAKLLTNVYYIEELRDLKQYGLEDELGYHAGGAVAASEVDPDVLARAKRAGVASLYIRKGTVGVYEDGTFEDEEGNTADIKKTDIKFLD